MKRINDQNVEQIIGQLLRAGVLLSAFVVVIGGILYLRQAAMGYSDYQTFHGVLDQLTTILRRGARSRTPRPRVSHPVRAPAAHCTPVARVVFSVFAFGLERDWLYVGLTLVVLAVLFYSLLQSA